MTVEEALTLVKRLLDRGHLSKIQEIVFRQSWEGQSYLEIASNASYDPRYVKDVGSKLWQLLSEALGEKVTKHNFRLVLRQRCHELYTLESQQIQGIAPDSKTFIEAIANKDQDWGEAIDASVFFGRSAEMALLK